MSTSTTTMVATDLQLFDALQLPSCSFRSIPPHLSSSVSSKQRTRRSDETQHQSPPPAFRPPPQHSPLHQPNGATVQLIASRLRRVTTLAQGKRVHDHIKSHGLHQDTYLASLLISMYFEHGDLQAARFVFDGLKYPSVVSWNCIITAYSRNKHSKEALQLFREMLQKGHKPNRVTFLVVLSACTSAESLAEGKWIHAYVVKEGFKRDVGVCNALITMYSRCGDLKESISIFYSMQNRNIISWNSVIAACAKHGEESKALEFFSKMQQQDIKPDRCTFLSLLGAFVSPESLEHGKQIYNCILDHGFHLEVSVCNALINMYSKCGAPDEAFLVFKQMSEKDIISWSTMIHAYSKHGHGLKAIHLFREMQQKGIKPKKVVFLSVIHACATLGDLGKGQAVHSLLREIAFPIDLQLGNSLIYMYGKCNAVKDARQVFDEMQLHDAVSWTTMLHVYASNEWAQEALRLFQKLQSTEIEPELSHYISALDACGTVCALEEGKALHYSVSMKYFATDVRIGNALISMYSKCGAIGDACRIFDNMPDHDVVSWNAIISAHGKEGNIEEAFSRYLSMQDEGLQPNRLTFIGVLSACISPDSLDKGRMIHTRITDSGLDMDDFLGNALIHMYGNCNAKEEACYVFYQMESPDLASWNAMLTAYCNCRDGEGALRFFQKLKQHVKPDKVTFLSIFKACSILGALDTGKVFHASLKDYGLESDATIAGAVINMYSKCKALPEACEVFCNMSNHDIASWTAMVDAYSQSGCYKEAIHVFKIMQRGFYEPNVKVLIKIITSFSVPAAIEEGKEIHGYMIENGFERNLFIGNALISMYSKCNSPEFALQAFSRMPEHDAVSWTMLMNLHLKSNQYQSVLKLYNQMLEEHVLPDQITFTYVLHACANMKSLTEGKVIHSNIVDAGYEWNVDVRHALREMYSKCGNIEVYK